MSPASELGSERGWYAGLVCRVPPEDDSRHSQISCSSSGRVKSR